MTPQAASHLRLHAARAMWLARQANAWLEPLRLSVCILAGCLAVTGFILARKHIAWDVVAAVVVIAISAMLQNDWRDRFHDVRKGRPLAFNHQRVFFAMLAVSWVASVGLIALAGAHAWHLAIALAAMAIASAVYTETRKLPVVPTALVALTSAAPAILPVADGASPDKVGLMFLSTALIVFAREVMKDLDDQGVDSGYKWTIPLAIGEHRARVLAAGAVFAGVIAAASVSLLVLPGAFVVAIAAIALLRGTHSLTVRNCLDAGMALVVLGVIAFG